MESPICRYCQQTYSRYNESIYIVCLCEEKEKYAHGSCFRNWLRFHDFGVCEVCLTKTKIVPDGRKSFRETEFPPAGLKSKLSFIFSTLWIIAVLAFLIWMLIKPCWETYCIVILVVLCAFLILTLISCCVVKETRKFCQNLVNSNRYWKIVYCREESDSNLRIKRRYSDVPLSAPWETVQASIYNDDAADYASSRPYKYKFGVNDFSGIGDINGSNGVRYENKDSEESGFSFPNVWAPQNYPYVKKNPVFDKDTVKARADSDYQVPNNVHYSKNSYTNSSCANEEPDRNIDAKDKYGDMPYTRGGQDRSSGHSNPPYKRGEQDRRSGYSNPPYTRGGQDRRSGHSNPPYTRGGQKRSSGHSNPPYTRGGQDRSSGHSNSSYVSTSRANGRKESQGEKSYNQLSYIDSRADSFYKNSDEVDVEKFRYLLQTRRQATSQTDLNRQQNITPASEYIYRSSSEPDLKKSRNETIYKRFSDLFQHDDQQRRRGSKHDAGDGSAAGRFRLKNTSDARVPSVMPKHADIVYKSSAPPVPSKVLPGDEHILQAENVKLSRFISKSSSEEKFPVQRSRSMYLPVPGSGRESPHNFDSGFNFIPPVPSNTRITPEPKKRPLLLQSEQNVHSGHHEHVKESSDILETKVNPKIPTTDRSSKILEKNVVNPKAPSGDPSSNMLEKQVIQKVPSVDHSEISKQKSPRKNKNLPKETKHEKDDTPNPEEIERIMTTPLNQLDLSELFDENEPLGKKRPSLFQGPNMSSLFYAPTN